MCLQFPHPRHLLTKYWAGHQRPPSILMIMIVIPNIIPEKTVCQLLYLRTLNASLHLIFTTLKEFDIIIIVILKMRKPRFREGK